MSTKIVLGCRPKELSEEEARLTQMTGFASITTPYEGSVEGVCQVCERPIWLGPRQQEAREAMPNAAVVCLICAALLQERVGEENTFIGTLGNPENPGV